MPSIPEMTYPTIWQSGSKECIRLSALALGSGTWSVFVRSITLAAKTVPNTRIPGQHLPRHLEWEICCVRQDHTCIYRALPVITVTWQLEE